MLSKETVCGNAKGIAVPDYNRLSTPCVLWTPRVLVLLFSATGGWTMRPSRLAPLALAACGLLAGSAGGQTPAPAAGELKVGDAAPDFTLQATDGKTYTLSKDLRGRWLVLAWFPKAFTSG
jgi:hypothetical protein